MLLHLVRTNTRNLNRNRNLNFGGGFRCAVGI